MSVHLHLLSRLAPSAINFFTTWNRQLCGVTFVLLKYIGKKNQNLPWQQPLDPPPQKHQTCMRTSKVSYLSHCPCNRKQYCSVIRIWIWAGQWHILQKAQVTPNVMVHKKRHHFLTQFSIPFHTMCSVLLQVLASKNHWIKAFDWLSRNFNQSEGGF